MFLTMMLAASLSGLTISETAEKIVAQTGMSATVIVPIEKIADPFVRDVLWISRGVAADLLSTSWALRRCPTCYEGNVIGIDAEARIALQIGGGIGAAVTCYEFRRAGKPKLAAISRWIFVATKAYAFTSNAVHAIRRK